MHIPVSLLRFTISSVACAMPIGVGLAAFGCSGGTAEDARETTRKVTEHLYLRGNPWPGGTVNVCFDPSDGNYPTLLAETQRVLKDSWRRAAAISFVGWGPCDYSAREGGNYTTVALHFCSASSRSSDCPLTYYDSIFPFPGSFRGLTLFTSSPVCSGTTCAPGVIDMSLVSDDPDPFQTRFRDEVQHEFGHALGFAHEQDRPDNFNSMGASVYCRQTAINTPGGTYETPFDLQSIMSYCAKDPLTGGYPTQLSSEDIFGVRKVYGRAPASHGFMIKSDAGNLAVAVLGGTGEGSVLALYNMCDVGIPECTWTYQRGMIVSDADPTLAINAWGGASDGTVLRLTRACTPDNPDCRWTYEAGEFLSDTDFNLAIKASGGVQSGSTLALTGTCTSDNAECTWTVPYVMLSSHRDPTLSISPIGGTANGAALGLNNACDQTNPGCTWTFQKGRILSDTNPSLAISATAADGAAIQLVDNCDPSSSACSWTWMGGELISDWSFMPFGAAGGAVDSASLTMRSDCTSTNPDCLFSGFVADNITLPPVWTYGGSFQLDDRGWDNVGNAANSQASSCSSGYSQYPIAPTADTGNRQLDPESMWGGNDFFCVKDRYPMLGPGGIAGMYQVDDCHVDDVGNWINGNALSCPTVATEFGQQSYTAVPIARVLAPESGCGAWQYVCVRGTSRDHYFGGTFQIDDCRSNTKNNPLTNAPSCPPGYARQQYGRVKGAEADQCGVSQYWCDGGPSGL